MPERTCIGCRTVRPSRDLTRVAIGPGGWVVGAHGRGRGAWICTGQEPCLDQAVGRGRLVRALRSDLGEGDLSELGALIRGLWMEEPAPEPLG